MTDTSSDADQARPGFRVGVTGHRPDQLAGVAVPIVRARLQAVFAGLHRAFPGRIELITSLAEGTDRIAAEEALHLGYALNCPLPFTRAEYEADFCGEESVAEFRRLLERAAFTEELPGSRATRASDARAYAAAGMRVVDQADVLVAVWNGREARGTGGTAEIVAAAKVKGIPTIWIDTGSRADTSLIEPAAPEDRAVMDAVAGAFHQMV